MWPDPGWRWRRGSVLLLPPLASFSAASIQLLYSYSRIYWLRDGEANVNGNKIVAFSSDNVWFGHGLKMIPIHRHFLYLCCLSIWFCLLVYQAMNKHYNRKEVLNNSCIFSGFYPALILLYSKFPVFVPPYYPSFYHFRSTLTLL